MQSVLGIVTVQSKLLNECKRVLIVGRRMDAELM